MTLFNEWVGGHVLQLHSKYAQIFRNEQTKTLLVEWVWCWSLHNSPFAWFGVIRAQLTGIMVDKCDINANRSR